MASLVANQAGTFAKLLSRRAMRQLGKTYTDVKANNVIDYGAAVIHDAYANHVAGGRAWSTAKSLARSGARGKMPLIGAGIGAGYGAYSAYDDGAGLGRGAMRAGMYGLGGFGAGMAAKGIRAGASWASGPVRGAWNDAKRLPGLSKMGRRG